MRKAFGWIVHRVKQKLAHFHPARLLDILKEHGMPLVIIIVGWEIIEDILFPLLFVWLGHNVNPWFIACAPVSWLLCAHPVAVPVLWGLWIKISGRENEKRI